ncbi:MAG TPA: MFS transporter [Oculatellaceae cyanobacterium]
MQNSSPTQSTEIQSPAVNVQAARAAIGTMFFINGGAVATWAARIPAVQDKLHLDTGPLGIALLSMGVGALIAMSIAGAVASSIGSRPVIVWTMYASCAALILPAFAPNLLCLALSVVILGIFLGSLDVAMNAHAVVVEKLHGSSIMSSFHALFSIGGIAGAIVGALSAWSGVGLEAHFVGSAIVLCVLGAVMQRWLLPSSYDSTGTKVEGNAHLETLKCLFGSRLLFAISITMFCCFLVEGAVGDWSGVYLRRILGSDPGFAALGYACFSVTMCVGRLTGDALIKRFGRLLLIRLGAIVALAGVCIVLIPKVPISALIGFSLIGLGVANTVPIGFAAAGNSQDVETGKAIATVSLLGYLGLLVGPPTIGFLAQAITLPSALWLLGILLLLVVVLSKDVVAVGTKSGANGESLSEVEYPEVI